ncbi:MAG: hypothetical protein V4773_08410 [Verrucomicrobiota bacterium]
MSRFRLSSIVAVVIIALGMAAVLTVLSSPFQTWALRKALASQSDLRLTLDKVDADTRRVQAANVRYEREGAVLTLPQIDAELPVLQAAFSEKVRLSRLEAKGWTLDLSKTVEKPAAAVAVAGGQADAPVAPAAGDGAAGPEGATPTATPATEVAKAFAGVFSKLRLPVDLSLDGVFLEGVVILPKSRGRVAVSIRGGGLAVGTEAKFDVVGEAALADSKVNAVKVNAVLSATMDTPRTFTLFSARLDAAASGTQFPSGVKLTAGLTAARATTGETYSASLVSEERQLVAIKADFPRDASRLDGTWKLDVRDLDVAPFALGHPLAAFTAVGEGKFDTDAAFAAVHATGKLNLTAGRLEILRPELAAVGAVKLTAQFDLTRRGATIAVQQLEATVAAAQPVATVTAMQSFEVDTNSLEWRASDPARELAGIVFYGLPLEWTKPFLSDVQISGGDLRGELVATTRGGGMTLRSRVPLEIERLSVARTGQPLVQDVDVTVAATADYTPAGWQGDVSRLAVRSGGAVVLEAEGKAGQLAGKGQPLKATGKIAAKLGPLLRQPALAGTLTLTEGDGTVEFIASFAEKTEVQAKVALKELSALLEGKAQKLPTLTAEVRADVAADGKIAVHMPVLLEHDGRKSDLTLAGSISPLKDKTRAIDAQLTSTLLTLDDAKILAAALPAAPVEKNPKPAPPPWLGFHGAVALQLKKVIYSETFEMTNVGGKITLDEGKLKLETVQVGLGESGRAALNGVLTFDANAAQPYGLEADVNVREFDPTILFHAMAPGQPATIEGKFDVSGKLTRRAESLADLGVPAGDFQITSKGGTFRGLPVNAATLAENTGKIAGWIASASSALGLNGRKEAGDVTNKAQAVAEVAKTLNAIAYDQLSLVVSRDAARNLTVREFALISPEVRLTGAGETQHTPGATLLEQALAMDYHLRARGRTGDLLKYLGALDTQVDDLGYSASTLPLKVQGTLAHLDTTELNAKLASLAVEKSGVGDKASEFFNRLMGGGK